MRIINEGSVSFFMANNFEAFRRFYIEGLPIIRLFPPFLSFVILSNPYNGFTVDLMRELCKNVPKLNTGASQLAVVLLHLCFWHKHLCFWQSWFLLFLLLIVSCECPISYIFADAKASSCSHIIYQNILWRIYYVSCSLHGLQQRKTRNNVSLLRFEYQIRRARNESNEQTLRTKWFIRPFQHLDLVNLTATCCMLVGC